MDNKKYLVITVISVILAFFLYGCLQFESYARLRLQSINGDMVTPQTLKDKWQDYTIYYTGPGVQNPSAILFDPKNDNKTIVNNGWIKVEDQETLSELILWIQFDIHFEPKLWRILGPDNQFYGYIYSYWQHVYMKILDEKTLWVDDLPLPPLDLGPARVTMS